MHVVDALGANVVTGHVIVGTVSPVDGEVNVSATATPDRVTLPLFVTLNEWVTAWPIAVIVVGDAVLAMVSAPDWVAVIVAVDAGEVTVVPDGLTPDAVAELLMTPLSRSAWVVA